LGHRSRNFLAVGVIAPWSRGAYDWARIVVVVAAAVYAVYYISIISYYVGKNRYSTSYTV